MSHLLAVCTCRHPCLQDTADQLWHWCFRLASVWCFCWSEQKGGSNPGKASLINHVVSLSSSLLSFIKSVQVWVNLWLQVCVIWFVCMGMVRNECARILKLFLRQQWGVATYMDWFLYSTLLNVSTQSTYTTYLFHYSHQHFFAVLSNIHTLTDALESNLGSVSCPRIFGLQTGAVGDRTTNLPSSR